ncbi:MAG: hypothetical protein EOP61_28090, partial [Sphingomonadales bacterium]
RIGVQRLEEAADRHAFRNHGAIIEFQRRGLPARVLGDVLGRLVLARGQTPSLELDDGTVIAESVAICRFLEALHPDPPLFGRTPTEIGVIEMWNRRVEMILMPPVGAVWVHTHRFTAALPGRNAEWGERNRPRIADAFAFFDRSLENSEFLAGDKFSMADILLLTTVDFATFIGSGPDAANGALMRWHEAVSARPSASA